MHILNGRIMVEKINLKDVLNQVEKEQYIHIITVKYIDNQSPRCLNTVTWLKYHLYFFLYYLAL